MKLVLDKPITLHRKGLCLALSPTWSRLSCEPGRLRDACLGTLPQLGSDLQFESFHSSSSITCRVQDLPSGPRIGESPRSFSELHTVQAAFTHV